MKSLLSDEIYRFLNRYDTIAVIVGAGIGFLFINEFYDHFHAQFGQLSVNLLGQSAVGIFYILNTVLGSVIAFSVARFVNSLILNHAHGITDHVQRYDLPEWPKRKSFGLVLGEQHSQKGQYVLDPIWMVIPERGLYGNIIVFGAIGSGKTAAVAYPAVRQILESTQEEDLKPGGLILDQKGNFNRKVEELCNEYNRVDDMIIISPERDYS